MRTQSQWLFEAPPILENSYEVNHYSNQKTWSDSELEFEGEWEADFNSKLGNLGTRVWQGVRTATRKAVNAADTVMTVAGLVNRIINPLPPVNEPPARPPVEVPRDVADLARLKKAEDEKNKNGANTSTKTPAGGSSRESEQEWEVASTLLSQLSLNALMESLAYAATEAESEMEATNYIHSLLAAAMRTSPEIGLIVKQSSPQLRRGLVVAVQALYRNPNTRPFLRTLPTILRRTVSSLKQRKVRGLPVTPQLTLKLFQNHTYRLLGNSQQTILVLQKSNAVLQHLASQYSNFYRNKEYEEQLLFESPFFVRGRL